MIVVPVYNKLVVPDADIYFRRDQFRQLAIRAVTDEKVVILFSREDQKREELTEDSFYPIGVSGTVKEISNEGYIVVRTNGRVNIETVSVNRDLREPAFR